MAATPSGIFKKFLKQAMSANCDLLAHSIKGALLNAATPLFGATGWGTYADVSGEITGTGYTAGGKVLAGMSLTLTDANSWATAWAPNTAYTVGQIVKPIVGNGFVYRCDVAGTSQGAVVPTSATNASPAVVTAAAHGLVTGNGVTITGVTGETNLNVTGGLAVVLNSSTYNLMTAATLALVNGNGAFGGAPTIAVAWPTQIGQSVNDGGVTWTCYAATVLSVNFTAPSWAGFTGTADALLIYDNTTGSGTSPLAAPVIAVCAFGSQTLTGGTLTVSGDATAFYLDLG